MESSVQSQMYIFLITLLGGTLIGFTYDLYRLFRYYSRPKKVKTYIQDLMFWILLSIGIIIFVNRVNEGELRGFIFIGFSMGIVLYSRLLSKTVIKYISHTINFIIARIKRILKAIFNPFKAVMVKLSLRVRNIKKYLNIPKLLYNNTIKNIKTVIKKK